MSASLPDPTSRSTAPAVELAVYRKALRIGLAAMFERHPSYSLTSVMILLQAPFSGVTALACEMHLLEKTVRAHIRTLLMDGYLASQFKLGEARQGQLAHYRLTPAGEELFKPRIPRTKP